ncbi:hypothetical protein MPSEU_000266200 [Mayamaea pseudoterrestris]|nr:hypothetical protein MPSEU_000266200 [Mayamaea pseudoterrestris]
MMNKRGNIGSSTPALLVASTTICLALTFLLWWPINYKSSNDKTTSKSSPIFTLLVTLTFDSIESKNDFMTALRPLAAYVQASEPNTLAYQLLESDSNPLQVTMLERYVNKQADYLEKHKSSREFQEFRAKLTAMQANKLVTVTGQSYLDSSIGYIKST